MLCYHPSNLFRSLSHNEMEKRERWLASFVYYREKADGVDERLRVCVEM